MKNANNSFQISSSINHKTAPIKNSENIPHFSPPSLKPSPSKIKFENSNEVTEYLREFCETEQMELQSKFKENRARLYEERLKEMKEIFHFKRNIQNTT